MSCSHIKTCPLFPLFRMSANLKIWQIKYCDSDHSKCERYKRSSNGERVPLNLLPNGTSLTLRQEPA